ncbi:DNA repair protein RAD16 [Schizosaccharomyces japonicus yFS275]|uniref:DNA repair protein RAD16 n=1 Tax=Schizosaccharomyces japonicus (strain yFS275 / FY16936) TaxID=402676 RepID=B6JVT3_SCHJY|nr:DNA repair protein RAD16 [Schizosaccharomyces japonicus yFS275]EEB05484.1 DNA repair protein RAD16 [Schizosaccharomyces japonicus yFS275]
MRTLESKKASRPKSLKRNRRSLKKNPQTLEIPVLRNKIATESTSQDDSSLQVVDGSISDAERRKKDVAASFVTKNKVSDTNVVSRSQRGRVQKCEYHSTSSTDQHPIGSSSTVHEKSIFKERTDDTAQPIALAKQGKDGISNSDNEDAYSLQQELGKEEIHQTQDSEEKIKGRDDQNTAVYNDHGHNDAVSVSRTTAILPLQSTVSSDDDVPLASLIALKRQKRKNSARDSSIKKKPARTPQMKEFPYYERAIRRLEFQHPELATLWDRLDAETTVELECAEQPKSLKLQLMPFQLQGLNWLKRQESSSYRGGILADEMGMGKTIQTIALLLSEPRGKPTLIVAPVVALLQWKSEIELHSDHSLQVYTYHGASRTANAKELCECDVVLTSYNMVETVYRKEHKGFRSKSGVVKEKSVLHSINFYRIVLDEAHKIKSHSNTTTAIYELQSDRKLCLTGTPLQNRIGEIFSLLKFLKADPFVYCFCACCSCKTLTNPRTLMCNSCKHSCKQHSCFFNVALLKPINDFGNDWRGQAAFAKVHILLRRIMLRRTKLENADDIGLPPRVVRVRRDLFSKEEEDLYHSLFIESKRKFDTYVEEGVVLNNYINIFQLITRMRQMADHPDLVLANKNKTIDVKTQDNFVCRICDEVAQDAIRSKCKHIFCRLCVSEFVSTAAADNAQCPSCFLPLDIDLDAPALEEIGKEEASKYKTSILNRIDMNNWRSSTKIEALVEELYMLRRKDRTTKSIVFSQFAAMLDLVSWRLRKAGFNCVRLEGGMTPKARDATIKAFCSDVNITVFLVSLKAGGIALNLTEASQVFMLDPWWNASTQLQAMDRIHRIGQCRPIRITTLCIENSIESKIIQLQEKKEKLVKATLDCNTTAFNQMTAEDIRFLFTS